ncbi:MAG TPA: helix-turn-helix domain-containing protein, partial [Candidatus Limnocylindrales bacterium]|nr:helix-turn-helix domain-containing protein [Candidatus Limnocylindrales bacterium]
MTNPIDDIDAIALLDEPVRRRLYEWVVDQGRPVGRDEAAAAAGVSRALAAFHLDRLAAAGLLTTEFRRLTGRTGPGAGRPSKLYARADRDIRVALPERRYDIAAEVMAEALEEAGGGGAPET